jgi:integrase
MNGTITTAPFGCGFCRAARSRRRVQRVFNSGLVCTRLSRPHVYRRATTCEKVTGCICEAGHGFSTVGLTAPDMSSSWASKNISRSVAAELANVKRTNILKGAAGIGRKKKDLSFKEAREKFERWAEANKKPNTVETYRECLRRLAESFGSKRLSEIAPFHVEGTNKSAFRPVRACEQTASWLSLKALFNRCIEWEAFEGNNPVRTVKQVKEPRQRLRYLEPEEEHRLLQAAPEPLRSIILVWIHCGLRFQAEALTLKWSDVNLSRRTLTVQAAYAKSGQTRVVPMNSAVHAALSRLNSTATTDYVFTTRAGKPYDSIRTGFESACIRAGLDDVTPHTTRHSFATRLIASGVDLRMVQELGGWSSLRMLERYGHVSANRKAQAVEKLVETFHNGFHNTKESTTTAKTLTPHKDKHGEVAEWPKAAVC